ncbi:GH36-type glycosyl hydrolase domain-containing protein [Marinilactibacillus psychrotolerans]|uniref:GH36-type glycosyl hydrolase domain-containing protein n=1 Tax=Marinilactibacillus psychrotolerans TaxID=191770 RepID=UPI003885290C
MKTLKQENRYMEILESGKTKVTFLQSGDLYTFKHDDIMINQIEGNMIDGSMNNIYLRFFDQHGQVQSYKPLLGIKSDSTFAVGKKQASWQGSFEGIEYVVRFVLSEESIWFWEVEVNGSNREIDIVYGQDLGLAEEAALKANEAYVAQYVDHKIIETDLGYSINSRQNQPQNGQHPYLQQGSLTIADGFLTDGFQFFGKSYKETNEPEAIYYSDFENKNIQFEFDYSILKSKRTLLNGTAKFVFYSYYKDSHPEAVENLEEMKKIQSQYDQIMYETLTEKNAIRIKDYLGEPLQTVSIQKDEIEELYSKRVQEEVVDETLLSFFTEKNAHVALKEKESLLERPHGHILFTHNKTVPDEAIMSTTSWIYGIFNAQLVLGNTDMNKALSNARNPINYFKTSGQRVYVKLENTYCLLAMPSLLEIGANYVKWLYKTEAETFIVTNLSSATTSAIQLSVESKSGKSYEYLVTNQFTMNSREYKVPVWYEERDQAVYFAFDEQTAAHQKLPDLTYRFKLEGATSTVVGEDFILDGIDEGTAMLLNFKVDATKQFQLMMQGSLDGNQFDNIQLSFTQEVDAFSAYFDKLSNGFKVNGPKQLTGISQKMNLTTWWYTHNMLVHYLVPHGLEQFGGAAWGTRDVSQGPAEYLMAMQQYESTKEIIKKVYTHQHVQDGNWPQWFMFDSYTQVQADESHGDVIVWPLKMLADYIEVTGDFDILDASVPYFDKITKEITQKSETIRDHVTKQLNYIQNHFLGNTFLSSYGDGDWDDTLQPHNESLKKDMASSWTIALTYQTLQKFAHGLKTNQDGWSDEVRKLSENIAADFRKYVSSNEVVPGFIYMPSEDEIVKMIHPEDTTTGIQYRLLPMIRGMISELFTKEQANKHYEIIQKHLNTPDGVRLMNRPATYRGGVSHQFKRAEQAANFGREIGLMYVHAHIRYIEAMAKIGKPNEIWKGLETINPINIQQVVENAELRQSNTYFSSSDADFSDRYEAQEQFDLVKKGEVRVKGGWRIYSSGPGIYMNQLVSNALGIRIQDKNLVLDPVLTKEMDGLAVEYYYDDKPLIIKYHYNEQSQLSVRVNNQEVTHKIIENPYRNAGVRLDDSDLINHLNQESNIIDVYYPVYS